MDGAVIFADIMTPLEAMGVDMTFDPGPRLGETIRRVRKEVADEVAVIGFAGAPVTLLAYLVEGGGSRDFLRMRTAVAADPQLAVEALGRLASAMNAYLALQVEAGVDVVQLFDTWAGVLSRARYGDMALPAARSALRGLQVPTIYFAPGAGHTLDLQPGIGASGYGVDWRLPIDEAWGVIGPAHAVQGNVDPAVLLTEPSTISAAVADVLGRVAGRPGHVLNLGHGIDRHTPIENVAAFVEAARR
jgi:uroporphyrinogen decarboxylase